MTFVAEQSYFFDASPQKVFQGLTDSRMLVKWFLSKAELDPQKGGEFTFDWMGGYHMTGKVKAFAAGKAVALSWTDRLKSGEIAKTRAAFKVSKKGAGALLTLRHTGFRDPEHFAECSSRWAYYLTNMKSVLDHGIDLRSKHDW